MKSYLLFILSFLLFFSCQKEKNINTNKNTNTEKETSTTKQQKDTNRKPVKNEIKDTSIYYLDTVFCLSVNKSIPPLKFEFRRFIENNEKDHYNLFYTITIIDSASEKTLQILDTNNLESLVQVEFDDFNFDGFTDMYIHDRCMILGNCFGNVFLYNNNNSKFDLAPEFEELTSIQADQKKKVIYSLNRSAAGIVFTSTTLKYIDSKLTIIELKEQNYANESMNKFHYIIKKRDKYGNLKTIKDEILKEPKLE